jgi:hypothetical protein
MDLLAGYGTDEASDGERPEASQPGIVQLHV